jgi:hypothetical protein
MANDIVELAIFLFTPIDKFIYLCYNLAYCSLAIITNCWCLTITSSTMFGNFAGCRAV